MQIIKVKLARGPQWDAKRALVKHAEFLVDPDKDSRVSDAIAKLNDVIKLIEAASCRPDSPGDKLGEAIRSHLGALSQAIKKGWISQDAPLEFFVPRWYDDLAEIIYWPAETTEEE